MIQSNTAIQNLLVIDSQVTDWQSLAAGAGADTAILILDSGADGLTQLSDYLSNASTQGLPLLQSIQIISHGSAGSLQLGSSTITKSNLSLYTKQLAKIGSSLTDTGDILLYGCNVAVGQAGLDFINQFAALTNADVAASNDITGSAALNGNWQLEANSGTIEVANALGANTQATYAGSLAIPVVSITAGITPVEGAAGSFIVTLDSPAPVGGLTINYSMMGSAILNTDYTVAAGANISALTNGSFKIAAGQTTASLIINAAAVDGYDPNETIGLSLHSDSSYSFVSNATIFAPKVDVASGLQPWSVSTADFNGDGKLDLAVTNTNSNTVSVLLRNAANTSFDSKVDYLTSSQPMSVSVGDFNGDGKIDLALTNYGSNSVSVLLCNAANTGFDPKEDVVTGSSPYSVSIGDFNGDGKTDLAVANQGSNTVSVLLRNAANTGFDPKVDFATGGGPSSVSSGDFNGDGKTDLAVANQGSNTVSVLLRNAANTGFDPKVDFATGTFPISVSVGDFNGDGKLDLAAANTNSNTVSVLLRNAANTDFDLKVDVATGSYPRSVSVGDFNGDGRVDLAVANSDSNTVSVLLRNTANTGFDPKVDFTTGSYPMSVSVGDFNGDGKTDLAVANFLDSTVSVLYISPNSSLTITDTHINTPPQLPVISPTIISGTLSAVDAINPFNAGNYFDAYTPTGFVDGTSMSLDLSSTAFDAYIQVIRNGSVFAFNDDSNGTTNSLINYTYQTGDKIYATSSGGLVTGAYSLNITGTTIPAFEVLTTLEDTSVTLTTTMLPIIDLEQRPDQLTYTLATLPLKGILSKSGINLSSGGTFTQADVDNGLILLTPNANANGTDSFTFSVADGLGGVLANQTFAINIAPVNDAPTLTTFAAHVSSGNEDNPIPVTFANLLAQGNEGDIDGTVTAFVIKAVSTGILKIGLSADTATDWSTGSNDVIDATHLAYWTPDANANGILNAFTAVAKDNGGLESVTTVQATVSVAEVPDVTVIAAVTPIEGVVAGAFKINLDSPAPVGGLTINYILSGSATLNTDYTVSAGTNMTAATVGNFTIAAGQTTAKLMINAGNEGIADPNETVTLNLMTGLGYQFSYAAAFDPKLDYSTGSSPYSVSVGDFNGDGKLDLVTANSGSNTISVFLRNASNTNYEPKVDFATDSGPRSVSVGDFNGDGKTDIVVLKDTVSMFLRNVANTGFDPEVNISNRLGLVSVSVGDFNGDGKVDMAIANAYVNTVAVILRNASNNGFDLEEELATGYNSSAVSVGDFNGDGKTDLVFANSILLRNATNTGFDPKIDFVTGLNPLSISVGDFNGDGKADLAVVNYGSNEVSVLFRNLDNTGFDSEVKFATGSSPYSVSVGDFNSDGKTDLAVANQGGNTVSVLLRNAANTGFDPKVDFATGYAPNSVTVGDLNGDGKTDLAVANRNSNTVSVLLNSTIIPTSLTITDHNPANLVPTLSAFTSIVATGNEDNQIAITFADLQTQGNEADVDGTVSAFVIKAVSTGTLLIGTSALTATAWNALTNNTVDATHQAYWTPTANANGTLNAFTVVAKDNGGLESASAIQAQISVANVNDLPTGTVSITGIASQGQQLTSSNNLLDADGMGTVTYTWYASGSVNAIGTGSAFTLTQEQVGKTISAVASYTDLFGTAESVSSSVTGTVANVNDLPTGSVSISGVATQGQQLTASNNLVDADGMGTVSYTWYASGSALSIGSGNTFTLTQAQVGKTISAVASYTDLLGTAESVSSSVTGTVANVNDQPTGTVSISGIASQGQQLTASNNLLDSDGMGTVTYTWYASGSATAIGTGSTFSLTQAQVGKTITVKAGYTDLLGTVESVNSAVTETVANVNDLPTGTVSISGTPTQGQQLTASNNLLDADGMGTVTYTWYASGSANVIGTGSTFTLTQAQVGKTLTVKAGYADLLGTVESISSSVTATVANVNDLPTGTVSISGIATQGQQLTASNNLVDADGMGTVTYTWYASGSALSIGTGNTFTLTQAQVGKTISAVASYTDLLGTAESLSSSVTGTVANVNDLPTGTVSISGVATQGQQLTASNNLVDTDGMGTVSYTWYASGSALSIGAGNTFTLTQAQVGKTLTVKAGYTDLLGTLESVSSPVTATVANVNDQPTGSVSISGTPTQGHQLTASNNLADADGMGTVTYTWYASGSALSIGTGSTFTLTQAQIGKTLTVKAGYTDLLGTVESVSSSVTATVANVNDLPTGSVSISGTPTQGQQLTASNNLADADGMGIVTYTWYASGSATAIGTGSTFTLTQAQVGKTISAVASYTDLLGTAESVSSAAVAILVTPPQTFVSTVANESFIAFTSNDTVSYVNARAGVKVSLLSPLAQNNVASGMGIDTLGSIANLIGSGFKDTLTGNAKSNVLTGGTGADVLIGGGGKDTYVVNIKATGLLEDTVTGNTGIDTIQVIGNSTNTTVAILKVAPIIENLDISGTGTSKLNITGNALANMLTGNAGNNLLNGGIGTDRLIGGAGNDSYTVDNGNDVVTEKTAEGIDLINSSVSYQLSANVENLTLTGKAAINANGNADNNILTGNAGMNSLSGNEGIDTLLGLAGNDSLNGGSGNDLLRGGAGNDRLTGGEGVDTFWFDTATNAKTNKDTLTDFVSGTDKLQFSVSVLKALGAVGQFTATDERFWSSITGLAHDATDRLIYNTTTGELSYDGNGSAKGGAVLIEVMGTATHPTLLAADIWVA